MYLFVFNLAYAVFSIWSFFFTFPWRANPLEEVVENSEIVKYDGLLMDSKIAFPVVLLNHNSLNYQTWPTDKYMQGQQFAGIFWIIWGSGVKFQVLFNLWTCSNYPITNYVYIPVYDFFEKVNEEHLKMIKFNYWKWPDLTTLYCHFNKIIKGPETSFHGPALSQKHVRNASHTIH